MEDVSRREFLVMAAAIPPLMQANQAAQTDKGPRVRNERIAG
jgi:hypothetical protein